jgi:site-specific DNA-methyltransferase (cytosine-N4-specific)
MQKIKSFYENDKGKLFLGDSYKIINNKSFQENYKGKIQLIFTSPPFPLAREKKYKNLIGKEYIDFIASYANGLSNLLTDDGSIVIEIGNSWNPNSPTMSTAPIEALFKFKESANLHLCQEFICNNPARLPGPTNWVNQNKIRVKDSYTRLWWLSRTEYPKANNQNVLLEYSSSMRKLLKRKSYNSGMRPSEHRIGKDSFLKKNKGSISSNFLDYDLFNRLLDEGGESALSISNTYSQGTYSNYCRANNLTIHPARMPFHLIQYFVQFLTDKNDIVLDPFAGSNRTGYVSQLLERKWISIELNEDYAKGSISRFLDE